MIIITLLSSLVRLAKFSLCYIWILLSEYFCVSIRSTMKLLVYMYILMSCPLFVNIFCCWFLLLSHSPISWAIYCMCILHELLRVCELKIMNLCIFSLLIKVYILHDSECMGWIVTAFLHLFFFFFRFLSCLFGFYCRFLCYAMFVHSTWSL